MTTQVINFANLLIKKLLRTKVPSFEGKFRGVIVVIECYCCIFYAFRTPEKKRKSEKTAWELNLKSAVASADYLRKFRTTERSKPSDHIVLGKTCDQR